MPHMYSTYLIPAAKLRLWQSKNLAARKVMASQITRFYSQQHLSPAIKASPAIKDTCTHVACLTKGSQIRDLVFWSTGIEFSFSKPFRRRVSASSVICYSSSSKRHCKDNAGLCVLYASSGRCIKQFAFERKVEHRKRVEVLCSKSAVQWYTQHLFC